MKPSAIAYLVCSFCVGSAYADDIQANESKADVRAVQFNQPENLSELLAVPPSQLDKVDVARINLLCAVGLRGSENLDVQQSLSALDTLAKYVERETKRNFHHFLERPQEFDNSLAYYQMGMLGRVLAEDLRIHYNPGFERRQLEGGLTDKSLLDEWRTFYSNSRDVFLHGLLTGERTGTCSSMPFLYVAIGRRLGYPVTIAARKLHLYVRYDAPNGEHLNVEATENRGFAAPTDEEYRNGLVPFPMTQEEIDGMGWLRSLSNKEILGICLTIRAGCLRSAKRHDEEIETWGQAARYLPDTALSKRVMAKNQNLARNLHAEERCYELWDEVEKLYLPTGGPLFEYFQNRKLQVQFFMKQSDNLEEIESSVKGLQQELRRYRNEISDNPNKIAEAYGSPAHPVDQSKFLALLQDSLRPRRLRIPQEKVPYEYWNGIPPELRRRLQGLTSEQEVIEEMHAYAGEETYLRNVEAQIVRSRIRYPSVMLQPGEKLQDYIHPDDLPWEWRNKPLPLELQARLLSSLKYSRDQSDRRIKAQNEIQQFETDQYQWQAPCRAIQARRSILDQLPIMHSPLQIEIIPTLVQTPMQSQQSVPRARADAIDKP